MDDYGRLLGNIPELSFIYRFTYVYLILFNRSYRKIFDGIRFSNVFIFLKRLKVYVPLSKRRIKILLKFN